MRRLPLALLLALCGCKSSSWCDDTAPADRLLRGIVFFHAQCEMSCGALPSGSAAGPRLSMPEVCARVAPGERLTIPLEWSGADMMHVRFALGSGRYCTVPTAGAPGITTRGSLGGAGTMTVGVPFDACDGAEAACLPLALTMQAISPAGVIGPPVTWALTLDCANGAGCAAERPAPCDLGPPPDMARERAPTGAPCRSNLECAKGLGPNQNPNCFVARHWEDLEWSDGYCSSPCRMALNDPDENGLNPDCPGGAATCQGAGAATGICVARCESAADCRAGYACFLANNLGTLGCMPASLSQCDPRMPASCPRKCGGAPGCFEDTCVNTGDGTVGACAPGCDPFTNQGCVGADNLTDCHVSDVTGEAYCNWPCWTRECQAGMKAGIQCATDHECLGGYGCLNGRCWKYCNDGNAAAQCLPGARCEPLSPGTKVPTAKIGICALSM